MNLYVIRDHLAGESGPIFEAKNDEVALRNYRRLLSGDGVNSEEYTLLLVGRIDHENDSIFVHDAVEVKNG